MSQIIPAPIRTALVLAAGRSTRLRTVTGDLPKPLVQVGGQAVLERNLRRLAKAGVTDVWINLHFEGEQIQRLIGNGERLNLHVRYSWEPELLGTAGAAKKLQADLAASPFAVIYGDNLCSFDLASMKRTHDLSEAVGTIAVFHVDEVVNTGLAGGRVTIGASERILAFEEGGFSMSPFVNAGVYILEPNVLDTIPSETFQDFGHDVFPALLRQGARLFAQQIRGYCLAIDTPEALQRAEELLATTDLSK